jgi:hypothetical protein
MKALSTLKSAIDQSSIVGIIALFSLVPVLAPHLALAAELQTSGQPAQIFEINVSGSSLLGQNQNSNNNQNSITIDSIQQTDPLTVDVQAFLQDHNSPFQPYTKQLLACPDWKRVLAISFVESNMGIHHYSFNSSGIGGQEYLRKYNNYGEWMNDMCNLLQTRYSGWTLGKMDGVYVQPYSSNWKMGSEKILTQLTALEQTANQQRAENAQALSANTQTPANLELATIAQ